MRNVERLSKPNYLKGNAARLINALLIEIEERKQLGKKPRNRFTNKYNHDEIRKKLDEMYDNLCCYCESNVGIVDYPHIEHRKPKSKNPELTYDWENLHLACGKCNIIKGDKYNNRFPILDAVRDNPISRDLSYEVDMGGVFRIPKTRCGDTTVDHTDLNRDELLQARLDVYLRAMKLIHNMNENPENITNTVKRQQLENMCSGKYGSLIKFCMDTVLVV